MNRYIEKVLNEFKQKDASQPEFLQALEEVLTSVEVIFDRHPEYEDMAILERLCEPERIITFKVPWMDDHGKIHVNRGYRVQYSSVLGPYKCGIRLHPSRGRFYISTAHTEEDVAQTLRVFDEVFALLKG